MKKRFLVLGISLLLLFSAVTVSAAEFVFPSKEGGSVNITEELKNVYTVGNSVFINANIKGGLHACGNTVIIRGDIDGSVHTVGGTVIVEGMVEDDLFVGGGNITLTSSSLVKGDLVVGGGLVTIEGPVEGKILLGAGEVIINSKIGGDVKIGAEKIELGDKAEIAGNFEYTSEKELDLDESKISGNLIFNQKETLKAATLNPKILIGLITLGFLLKLLGLIAVGLVFVYLLKKFTGEVVKEAFKKFWPNLGIGFGGLILIPAAIIILFISVIGIWIAGILMTFYGLLMTLASVIASIILGAWLIKVINKKKEYVLDWRAVVVGVIAMKILVIIPFVGWLAKLVFFLIAISALLKWFHKKLV